MSELTKENMKKTLEPFWWALFGAGGAVAALFIPALLFLTGIAIPLGWVDAPRYEDLFALVQHPIMRLLLFVVISLSLFHWGHRFRYTLYDGLQLKHLNELVAIICYGGAIMGTIAAGYTLLTM